MSIRKLNNYFDISEFDNSITPIIEPIAEVGNLSVLTGINARNGLPTWNGFDWPLSPSAVEEAPTDGKQYARRDGNWSEVESSTIESSSTSGSNLMVEYIVPATCQEFTLTNLDSNSWGGMYVELMLVRPVTGQIGIDMYINSDETYSKYAFKLITFGTSSGSPSVYGSSGSFGSAQIYTDGAPNGSVNTIGGCMIDIMHLNDTVGYISRQFLSPVGYYQQAEVKYVNTAVINNITSLKFKAYSAGWIGAGTRVRVYSKKTNISSTQDQTQSVIDLTNASSDYSLQVGQTATITYTSATNVPLHVATAEGLYEIKISGDRSVSPLTDNATFLKPNNTTVTGITRQQLYALSSSNTSYTYTGTTETAFEVGEGIVGFSNITLSTFTKNKSISCNMQCALFTSSNKLINLINHIEAFWSNTTTAWTSLGTITFPFAQSGNILIKRIA